MRALLQAGVAMLLATGCSGNDKDAETGLGGPTCDDIVTEPLGVVPTDEWPDGLSSNLSTYLNTAGRYEVTSSCGDDFAVKFTLSGQGTQEDLEVVTEPWDPQLTCGCVSDTSFDPDSKYDAVALAPAYEFFIEDFGAAGIDNSSLQGTGVVFGTGEPMVFRICAVKDIDPNEASDYEQVTAVMRVDPGGVMSGALVLTPTEGPVETCELTSFTQISAR